MTTFVSPDAVTVIIERAKSEPCTCLWTAFIPDDLRFDQCLRCVVLGLLQPTVTAYEPTI